MPSPRLQRCVLAISSTAATLEKAPLYWEIFGPFIGGEIGALRLVAEGEELGSNLLQGAQGRLRQDLA
jgi:hypothetical protein